MDGRMDRLIGAVRYSSGDVLFYGWHFAIVLVLSYKVQYSSTRTVPYFVA